MSDEPAPAVSGLVGSVSSFLQPLTVDSDRPWDGARPTHQRLAFSKANTSDTLLYARFRANFVVIVAGLQIGVRLDGVSAWHGCHLSEAVGSKVATPRPFQAARSWRSPVAATRS